MIGYVNLHGFDLVQVYITLGFTVVAVVSNGWLTFTAPRRFRPIFAAIASLAFFYTVAYSVLLVGPWQQSDWTRAIRGPSWIVWGFVWTYVPWKLSKMARQQTVRTAELVPKVAEALVERVKEATGVES